MKAKLTRVLLCLPALAALFAPCGIAGPYFESVYTFTPGPREPAAELLQAADGNFYGTTRYGGAGDSGTVFKMTPTGVITVLVEFAAGGTSATGSQPVAGLVQGTDGNFYGTTLVGGTSGYGTVFKMTAGGVLTTLVHFTSNGATHKGNAPMAGLVEGSDGNFYGTTSAGGTGSRGTVFKVTPGGGFTTLVNFTDNGATNKGAKPQGRLVQGSDGNFYGTTAEGGTSAAGGNAGLGTVFKMTPDGVLTTLANFTRNGVTDKGANPLAGLVRGKNGNFYGTTRTGGTSVPSDPQGYGYGTVFEITSAGVLTTLVNFTGNGASNKGSFPLAGLVQGTDGNFYGTTSFGGTANQGAIFKMTPAGALTTLVNFDVDNGFQPVAGLVQGTDGDFYGTVPGYLLSASGMAFKMKPGGALAILTGFPGTGQSPRASLVQRTDGNFYGTTAAGGATGQGTAFKITPFGQFTPLANFVADSTTHHGANPTGALVPSGGVLFGTTYQGGTLGHGTAFKMTLAGALTTLVNFTNYDATNKGDKPQGLILGIDANFYGTTAGGGTSLQGTVFKMTAAGALTTLVNFTGGGGGNEGFAPNELVQVSNGNFFGTTSEGGAYMGTVFKMTPAGVLTTLVEFTGNGAANKGSLPLAGLVLGTNGNFYGTTYGGGTSGQGTVFKMTPAGVLTTLVNFTGTGTTNKGANPQAGLVQGIDGLFYGTTYQSAANGLGTVFKMTPGGTLTTLVEFTGSSGTKEGGYPLAALIKASDGNLYGTTAGSGSPNLGTIFRLRFGPTPITLAATAIASTSATLNGTVNPRGLPTPVSFEIGTAASLSGAITLAATTLPAVGTPQPVSFHVTGLTAHTKYYFRIKAQNSANAIPQIGATLSFATLP